MEKPNKSKQEQLPEGVSQWREYGKKFQYWDFFEKGIRADERKRMIEQIFQEMSYIGVSDSNEKRRGYDIAIEEIKNIINK